MQPDKNVCYLSMESYPMNRTALAIILILLVLPVYGCSSRAPLPAPPTVTLRDIGTGIKNAKGEQIELGEGIVVYLPPGLDPPAQKDVLLTMHFHGVTWYPIEEHVRRGATNPFLVFGGRQGSTAYKEPFLDRELFARLIADVERILRERGAPDSVRVDRVEISSFSAGYGAVREIIKTPEYVDMIEAIVLADSFYASFAIEGGGEDRRPLPEHIEPFAAFARQAVAGDKTMIVAFSQIVTPNYASTADTAKALVEEIGGAFEPVEPSPELPSSLAPDYPLIMRYDAGGLHVWGYQGDGPKVHMAIARQLADYWWALGR